MSDFIFYRCPDCGFIGPWSHNFQFVTRLECPDCENKHSIWTLKEASQLEMKIEEALDDDFLEEYRI